MRSDTIDDIDSAIREAEPPTFDPREGLLRRARVEMNRVSGAATPEEARAHTLRAIAYLVRRLELDAPGNG